MKFTIGLVLVLLIITIKPLAFAEEISIPEDLIGKTINEINFQHNSQLKNADLLKTSALSLNAVLTPQLINQAIQNIHKRGVFQEIQVYFDENDDEVELTFILTALPLLKTIDFSGNRFLTRLELQRISRLQLLRPYNVADVEVAKREIKDSYASEGFLNTRVESQANLFQNDRYVALQIKIYEGEQARINSATLKGDLPSEFSELQINIEKFALGKVASVEFLSELAQLIRFRLRAEGFLEARVEELAPEFINDGTAVNLSWFIDAGDPLSISFTGNSTYSADNLINLLRLQTRTVPFGPSAVPGLVRAIERKYREDGFFYVSANSIELEPTNNRRNFLIEIEEGPKISLDRITLKGNKLVNDQTLLELIQLSTPSSWPLNYFSSSTFTPEQIEEERIAIEDYYHDHGYINALVESEVEVDSNNLANIIFTISEGAPLLIASSETIWPNIIFKVDSNERLELLKLAPYLEAGEVLSFVRLEDLRLDLHKQVLDLGYPLADVTAEVDVTTRHVKFTVDLGSKVNISEIIVQGNYFTHDNVIKRSLPFKSGQAWNPISVELAEQRLIQLGLFRDVKIAPANILLDQPAEKMIINVAERDTARATAGASINTEDGLRLHGELSQRNLLGTGNALALRADGYFKSTSQLFDAGQASATFSQPFIFGTPITTISEVFVRNSLQLANEFSFDQYGTSFFITTPFPEKLRWRLGLRPFNERVYDVPEDMFLGPDDRGTIFYNILNTELIYDSRDDRFNPRRGTRTSLAVDISDQVLGSEVNYYAARLDYSFYFPLSSKLVWANRARGWFAEPLRDTELIPLNRRIFLGGRNTIRGFKLNKVGPQGFAENFVGGDIAYVINSEMRYDILSNLLGVFFVDIGQAEIRNKGSFTGEDEELSDPRFAWGLGLKYRTPLGPLGLDLGFPIERRSGESAFQIFVSLISNF